MKRLTAIMTAAAFAVPAFYCSQPEASTLILLKNGRTISADICMDSGEGKLTCSKMEGFFIIDKKDVQSTRESSSALMPENGRASAGSGTDAGKDGAQAKTADQKDKTDHKKRFEEIREKKQSLAAEREKLIKERDQLIKDAKDAQAVRKKREQESKAADINARNKELDEKIAKFNEEISKLNKEEKEILDASGGTQEKPQAR